MAVTDPALHDIETLYSDHHCWLQGWLRHRLGCTQQAADLAQDTFVKLLLKKAQTSRLSTPRVYLAHIAKGLVIDHWRRQALEREYLQALQLRSADATPSPELQSLIVETLLEIDAMLDKLPAKVRQAFLLAQIDGLTYREIGQALGVSERMVKKYMASAMLHCMLFKRQFDSAAT